MGKSSPKVKVHTYRMSVMFGWCHGVVSKVHRIFVKEKEVWAKHATEGPLFIDAPDAFGGIKKEGGAQGYAYLLNGTTTQKLDPVVATKQGGTPDTLPGQRGLAVLTFTEGVGSGGKKAPGLDGAGFYWGANQPFVPPVWAELERIGKPSLLTAHTAPILRTGVAGAGTEYTRVDGPDDATDGTQSGNFETTLVDWARDRIYLTERDMLGDSTYMLVYAISTMSFIEKQSLALGGMSGMIFQAIDPDTGYLVGTHFEAGPVFYEYVYDPAAKSLVTQNDVTALPSSQRIANIERPGAVITNAGGAAAFLSIGSAEVRAHSFPGLTYQTTFSPPAAGLKPGLIQRGAAEEAHGFWSDADELRVYRYSVDAGGLVSETLIGTIGVADVFPGQSFDVPHLTVAHYDPVLPGIHFWLSDSEAGPDSDQVVVGYDLDAATLIYVTTVDGTQNVSGTIRLQTRLGGDHIIYDLGDNNYLQSVDIRTGEATQVPVDLDFEVDTVLFYDGVSACAYVWQDENVTHQQLIRFCFYGSDAIFDMNPSHIIVECLTNPVWGLGHPNTAIDGASFQAAADVLIHDEGFGLSILWTRQTTIEKFVQEILDHIEAVLFIHPQTGLFTLKLIRADYDVGTLRVLDPTNFDLRKFNRRQPTEAVNEIVVSWTNPETEQSETVTIQDLGAIVAAGRVNSDARNYYGVHKVDLASRLAARDIRSAAAPLASAEGDLNREFWDIVPGEAVKLVYPEYGIEASDPLIMRLMHVDYGKPGASKISVKLTEDVFSLTPQVTATAPTSEASNQTISPTVADDTRILTLPYFFAYNMVDPASLGEAEDPEVFMGALVAETDSSVTQFELHGEVTDAAGNTSLDSLGERDIAAQGTLPVDFPWEAETSVSDWGSFSNGPGPEVGGFLLISADGDTEQTGEICMLSALAGGVWTVKRGVLDTVPRAWPAGTKVWFLSASLDIQDNVIRAAADVLDYKVTPRASGGTLPLADAPLIQYTATRRPHLPSRPANVAIDGKQFQDVFYTTKPATVDFTWADRNRETENSQVLGWLDAGVTPETGQTVEVDVFDDMLTLLHTFTGLTGGSANLDETEFSQTTISIVRIYAARDGLRSLQYYEARVDTREGVGYGFNYGNNYGGI